MNIKTGARISEAPRMFRAGKIQAVRAERKRRKRLQRKMELQKKTKLQTKKKEKIYKTKRNLTVTEVTRLKTK